MSAPARPTRGTLYLIPNLLGVVEPSIVLPQRTIDVARELAHFVVESHDFIDTHSTAIASVVTMLAASAVMELAP